MSTAPNCIALAALCAIDLAQIMIEHALQFLCLSWPHQDMEPDVLRGRKYIQFSRCACDSAGIVRYRDLNNPAPFFPPRLNEPASRGEKIATIYNVFG